MTVHLLEGSILEKDNMKEVYINPQCCWQGQSEVNRYLEVQKYRKEKYDYSPTKNYSDIINSLNENGYVKIENFIQRDRLDRVLTAFNKIKQNNELQYDDIYTEQVGHPLLTCDGVFDIAFEDKIVEIAGEFFDCLPAINNVQLRKSKSTHLKETELPKNGQTTLWHCDKDSPRFLKFFFYLTDVKEGNGPFTYVHQSHKLKFDGWRSKYRWSDKEIIEKFGQDRIVKMYGNVGDLIIANTNGFHKGTKIESGERILLTIYTGIHPTEWKKLGGRMKNSDYLSLPDWKKPLAVYINKEGK